MSESKKEWKVVDGYYPGFLNIVGASYTVRIVTSATDLTLEDYVNRTNDAHLMAAAPDLLEALEMAEAMLCRLEPIIDRGEDDSISVESEILFARAAISKARVQQ